MHLLLPPRPTVADRRGARRWPAPVAAACLVAVTGCGASEPSRGGDSRSPGSPVTVGAAPSVRPTTTVGGAVASSPSRLPASGVLRTWDRARADAFASGDVAALRQLYVRRSPAGVADVTLLRRYLRRGMRVEGMRMQLLQVDVLDQSPRRISLRVTDRVTGTVAVGDGCRTELPTDRASTRVVVLRRATGTARWQMVSVRDVSR